MSENLGWDPDDPILPPDLDADWEPYLPPGASDDATVQPLDMTSERYLPLRDHAARAPRTRPPSQVPAARNRLSGSGWEP